MFEKTDYQSPEIAVCPADCETVIASSPTGEDFTMPAEYGGF